MNIVEIGVGSFRLREDAARSFARMVRRGMPTSKINSAYRSYDEQAGLFLANYTSNYAASSKQDRRVWKGVAYYRKAPFNSYVSVAIPGSSLANHQNALALDVQSNPPSPMQNWLLIHGAQHGWSRTIASEAWHWEYNGDRDQFKNEIVGEDVKLVRTPNGAIYAVTPYAVTAIADGKVYAAIAKVYGDFVNITDADLENLKKATALTAKGLPSGGTVVSGGALTLNLTGTAEPKK